MDKNSMLKLVDAATELVNKYSDGNNHTVAAAVLTKTGHIYTSLNFYHFTGGPDAEVAVLARVVSEGDYPLAIVAVGDAGRGVLSPCGRCRQTMIDYYPDLQVVLPNDTIKTVQDLLPDAFNWHQQQN